MSDANVPAPAPKRNPLVSIENGSIFTDSVRLARDFDKEHKAVLRVIRELECSPEFHRCNFAPGSYSDQNGKPRPFYTMTRKGFSFLAMGFTGAKAAEWKEKYIDAFELAYEELSRRRDVPNLSDPKQLLKLLAEHAAKSAELQDQVEEMMPSVHALDRIAISDGALSITDAAKNLQISRNKLFDYLRDKKWIYRRQDSMLNIAYQDKLNADLLEHKVNIVQKADGSDLMVTQVRVTPKGLTRLARELK